MVSSCQILWRLRTEDRRGVARGWAQLRSATAAWNASVSIAIHAQKLEEMEAYAIRLQVQVPVHVPRCSLRKVRLRTR